MPEFPAPLLVGPRTAPRVRALLDEMADLFTQLGVDPSVVSPCEVTCLRKSPGRVIAIPLVTPGRAWP